MSEGIKALEVILKDRITNNSLDKNIEEVIIIVKELLKLQEYRDYEKELGITFKDIYLARKGKKAKPYLIHFSNGDKKLCYAFDEKEARILAENVYRVLEIVEVETDEDFAKALKPIVEAVKKKVEEDERERTR